MSALPQTSGYMVGYSQVVDAIVPADAWEEVFFSLQSLKATLQSIPGFLRMDVTARDRDEQSINLTVVTNFEHSEQLEIWLEIGITPDQVLRHMTPPVTDIHIDVREIIV